MGNLFISYTKKDQIYAEDLKASLKKLNIVGDWEPAETTLQNQEIDEVIRGRLEAADAVLVLLSPKALASSEVLFEVGAAQASGKKVVPVILPDTNLDQIDFLDKSMAVLDAGTLSLSEMAQQIEALMLNGEPITMASQPTGFEYIVTDVKDGIGRLTLNRPEVLNALHQPMMGEIIEAVSAFEADDRVRVMLIDAAGRGFSAGADFKFLDAMTQMTPFELKKEVYSYFAGGIKAIKLFAKPTVAAVNGPATGGGLEIALACDFRIAGESALFIQSWINLGLISPLGGMYLLPRLIGLNKANEMLMLGKPVRGPEAAAIGLVNETVSNEALAERAWALAAQLAAGPPLGLRAMKEGIRRGMESTLASEWEHNVYVQSMLLNTQDYRQGVAALRERRPPMFEGH